MSKVTPMSEATLSSEVRGCLISWCITQLISEVMDLD